MAKKEEGRIEIVDDSEWLTQTRIVHEHEEMMITRWKKIEQAEIIITQIGEKRRTLTSIVLIGKEIDSLRKALEE